MHKLTDDRMKWGALALLVGMVLGVGSLLRDDLARALAHAWAYANDTRNALHLFGVGSGCQVAAGIALLVLLDRAPQRPGRETAIYLASGMACLPLIGPVLTFVCWGILGPAVLLLIPLLALLAGWLLFLLSRMRHWPALPVALVGIIGTLVAFVGWLGVLSDM